MIAAFLLDSYILGHLEVCSGSVFDKRWIDCSAPYLESHKVGAFWGSARFVQIDWSALSHADLQVLA